MHAFPRASILAALLLIANLAQAADAKKLTLKVVDEQGHPVPKFEALIYSGAGLKWAAGTDGAVSLSSAQLPPTVRIIVRADGYASSTRQFAGDDREKLLRGETTMALARGEEVKLQFRLAPGMIWPQQALPQVYFEGWQEVVQSTRSVDGRKYYETRNGNKPLDLNMLNLHPDGAGHFVFRLGSNTPPITVGIDIPGFLQYFDDGPFTEVSFKQGLLQIDVPQPANLELQLDVGNVPREKLPFKSVGFAVLIQSSNRRNYVPVFGQSVAPGAKSIHLTDIPPGNYLVSVITLADGNPNAFFGQDADPRRFRDNKQFTLRAGQTEKVDFQYVPLNLNAFVGNRTAIVRFETGDDQPAVGRDVSVKYFVEHYGRLPVYSGKVPESGDITLSDITAAKPTAAGPRDPYSVSIGKDQVGGFSFKTDDPAEHFAFRCPAVAGDMAPNVDLLNVADGKTIKLSQLRGKIVVLDFWATWCGPCQAALEKLDQVVAEKSAGWQDRVVVLPVSIDDEPEHAKQHLIDRGWTHLNPYWTGAEGKLSFEAPAMQAFVVNGVPCSFLIDREGKILWRGHPLSSEGGKTLEDRIDEALK